MTGITIKAWYHILNEGFTARLKCAVDEVFLLVWMNGRCLAWRGRVAGSQAPKSVGKSVASFHCNFYWGERGKHLWLATRHGEIKKEERISEEEIIWLFPLRHAHSFEPEPLRATAYIHNSFFSATEWADLFLCSEQAGMQGQEDFFCA